MSTHCPHLACLWAVCDDDACDCRDKTVILDDFVAEYERWQGDLGATEVHMHMNGRRSVRLCVDSSAVLASQCRFSRFG